MAHDHTSLDNINCPNCGELIPVSQTIYHQIAEQARADLRAEALERQKALAEKEKRRSKRARTPSTRWSNLGSMRP